MIKLKPEKYQRVNNQITFADIKRMYEQNETITGSVICYSLKNRSIRVYLGNGFVGTLPFDEVCLDDLKFIEGRPAQVIAIEKKKAIRVKISSIIDEKRIHLSRKANLREVLDIVKKNGQAFYTATVENAIKGGIFCDIGEGLIAYCCVAELSKVFIEDAREWVKVGQQVRVKITNCSDTEDMLYCSVKKAAMGNCKKIQPKTKRKVRIGNAIKDENGNVAGYFVEVTPAIAGIADIRLDEIIPKEYKNGDFAMCYVRSVNPEKHRVKLFLNN